MKPRMIYFLIPICLCCLLIVTPSLAEVLSVDCLAEHDSTLYRVDMGIISRMTNDAWETCYSNSKFRVELLTWIDDTCYALGHLEEDSFTETHNIQDITYQLLPLRQSENALVPAGDPIVLPFSYHYVVSMAEKWCSHGEECSFFDMVADETSIYFLAHDPETNMGQTCTLYQVSLATGETTALSTGDYAHLALCQGILYMDVMDTAHISSSLMAYDPLTDIWTEIESRQNYAFAAPVHDPETDTIYYTCGSDIKCYNPATGASTVVCPSEAHVGAEDGVALLGNFYVAYCRPTVFGEPVYTQVKHREQTHTIAVNCGQGDPFVLAYRRMHPEISFRFEDIYPGDYAQRVVTQEPTPHVYQFQQRDGDFDFLLDKGYLTPLDDCTEIAALAESLYPALRESLTDENGRISAVPTSLNMACGFAYSPQALADAGLTEDDLPTTMLEMTAFIEEWQALADAGEVSEALFGQVINGHLWSHLLSTAIETQLNTQRRDGEDLNLCTPELIQVVTWLDEHRSLSDLQCTLDDWDITPLFQFDLNDLSPLRDYSWQSGYQPMSMAMDGNHEPILPVEMSVYAVNRFSAEEDQAAAKTFLNSMPQMMQPLQHVLMQPEQNEPILDEEEVENLKNAQAELDRLLAVAAEVEGVPSASLQESIDIKEGIVARTQQSLYVISAEQIAAWREIAPTMYVITSTWDSYTSTKQVYEKFRRGQVSAEQFLRELERILQMEAMESQ